MVDLFLLRSSHADATRNQRFLIGKKSARKIMQDQEKLEVKSEQLLAL